MIDIVVLALLTGASAPSQVRGDEDLGTVLRAVEAGELAVEEAVGELTERTADPSPFFDVLAEGGFGTPEGWRPLGGPSRDVVVRAFWSVPASRTDALLDGLGPESTASERRAGIALLERRADGAALLRAAAWLGGDRRSLDQAYRRLVGAALREDPLAAGVVRGLLVDPDEPWTAPLLQALGDWRDTRALVQLSSRLYDDLPHLPLALRQVERLADLLDRPDPVLGYDVRRYLRSRDPAVCEAAAGAAAALGDHEAAGPLVDLLGSDRATVRSAASRALRELSGAGYGADEELWRSWLVRERSWWNRVGAELELDLWDAEPELVVATVSEACRHPLYRRELAGVVSGLLDDPRPERRELACVALAQLGAAGWVEELRALRNDRAEVVRAAARRALDALVENESPPEPRAR